MHLVVESGEKIDDQNVKNPWNWSWCEKVKVFSITEKLYSRTWNRKDTITLMVVSTIGRHSNYTLWHKKDFYV